MSTAASLSGDLGALLGGLEAQVSELKALMPLRNLGEAHVDALQQLEMLLSAAEADAARAAFAVRLEAEDIRALRALQRAAAATGARLQAMQDGAPDILPGEASAALPGAPPERPPLEQLEAPPPPPPPPNNAAPAPPRAKQGRVVPPFALVTEAELQTAPSYMRGRLDVQKVNATLQELHACLKQRYALLGTPSAALRNLSEADRRRVGSLKELENASTKAIFYFSEEDLKAHPAIRQDATGKNLLAILRHVGRIKEFKHGGMRCWKAT